MKGKIKRVDVVGKIIAIANQKGGVGKTTTSVNLAASFVATKRHVLLIDLDAQGNATMGSGIDKNRLENTLLKLLLGQSRFDEICVKSPAKYDLLPSNSDLASCEKKLLQVYQHEKILSQILSQVYNNYDFIIIDCPPALNILTLNALVAADSLLIPVQCEYYALEGLSSLISTVNQIGRTINPRLKIEGILRTMYDGRNRLSTEVSDQLLKHFGSKVYRTIIPRNVRLAEAPSHGVPVLYYDKDSQGAIAYLALAGEILRRQRKEGT